MTKVIGIANTLTTGHISQAMTLAIVDFTDLTNEHLAAAARVLREALVHLPSGYQGLGEAEAEVETRRNQSEWIGFAAVEKDTLIGWIGAIRTYSHGWEIHPLVVDPSHQRRGVGSALVAKLETNARANGVITLYLGSDDEHGGTNLFGRDLFPNVLGCASSIEPVGTGHALTFYRRHGYQIVGLLPDVNGLGRPDIFMAKRVG